MLLNIRSLTVTLLPTLSPVQVLTWETLPCRSSLGLVCFCLSIIPRPRAVQLAQISGNAQPDACRPCFFKPAAFILRRLSSSLMVIVQFSSSSARAKSTHDLQSPTTIQWRIGNSIIPRTPLNKRHLPTRLNFVRILSSLHIDDLNSITLVTATSKVRAITAETQCLDRTLGAIEGLLADEVGGVPECDECIGTACCEPGAGWRERYRVARGCMRRECMYRFEVRVIEDLDRAFSSREK